MKKRTFQEMRMSPKDVLVDFLPSIEDGHDVSILIESNRAESRNSFLNKTTGKSDKSDNKEPRVIISERVSP